MRLLPPDEGPPKDGFNTSDLFNRKALADSICNSFRHFDDNKVVLINGSWGSGKTFFIKQFEVHCESYNFFPVYFDAHEYDYTRDALGSILSEFANRANQLIDDGAAIKLLAESAGRVALAGLRGLAMGVAEAATAGVAGQIKGRVEASISTPEYLTSSIAERVLDARGAMHSLRASIKDISDRVRRDKKKDIIIIIDELDRCRPDFALEVIEVVKHLFSGTNIRFIISTDLHNLNKIVNGYYTNDIDAKNYLLKFYNIRFDVTNYKSRGQHVLDAYGALHEEKCMKPMTDALRSACEILRVSSKNNNFSIRQMQRCYQYLAISYSQVADNSFDASAPFVFISIALASGGEIPSKIRSKTLLMSDVTNLLGISNSDQSRAARFLLSYFEYIILGEEADDWDWPKILSRYNFNDNSDSLKIVLERFFDNFSIS